MSAASSRPWAVAFFASCPLSMWLVAGGAQADLVFEGTAIPIAAGERFIVSVDAEEIPSPGLAAFQLEILFDPAHVAIRDPNAGSPLLSPFAPLGANPLCVQVRAADPCPDQDWLLESTDRLPAGTHRIDPLAGRALIAYGTSGEEALPMGGGSLAVIGIERLSSEDSALMLHGTIVADDGEPPMRLDAPLRVTLVPEPLSVWRLCAAGAAVLALGGARRVGSCRSP